MNAKPIRTPAHNAVGSSRYHRQKLKSTQLGCTLYQKRNRLPPRCVSLPAHFVPTWSPAFSRKFMQELTRIGQTHKARSIVWEMLLQVHTHQHDQGAIIMTFAVDHDTDLLPPGIENQPPHQPLDGGVLIFKTLISWKNRLFLSANLKRMESITHPVFVVTFTVDAVQLLQDKATLIFIATATPTIVKQLFRLALLLSRCTIILVLHNVPLTAAVVVCPLYM